jgi:hypothetical protein
VPLPSRRGARSSREFISMMSGGARATGALAGLSGVWRHDLVAEAADEVGCTASTPSSQNFSSPPCTLRLSARACHRGEEARGVSGVDFMMFGSAEQPTHRLSSLALRDGLRGW